MKSEEGTKQKEKVLDKKPKYINFVPLIFFFFLLIFSLFQADRLSVAIARVH